MKLLCLIVAIACSVGSILQDDTSLAADRPNILLFTADDLHAESLGAYGGMPADVTPNLDAFAAESLLFNKAHVNVAICAPCRAVIATGRYSHRSGAMGIPQRDPGSEETILLHGQFTRSASALLQPGKAH